jgi:ubiquitin-protein ligase
MKRLQDEPIPLAAAQPCSDEDMTLWDGVVGVEMEVTDIGCITVPLHFLIDFPADYPQSAPNIGFSFEFEYRGGAQYNMPDGRLKGKKVICLDILGNFGNYHQEWKNSVGSGWSPAYTVTTLLVQLQSVLCDLGTEMSQRERDVTYQSAVRFCEKNPSAILELLDEEDIRERREERHTASCLAKIPKICGTDLALAKRIELFIDRTQVAKESTMLEEFFTILTDVARGGEATQQISEGNSTLPCTSPKAIQVDSNICCFATGRLYTEALLGVGVGRVQKNLGTAAELLSKEAFDGGFRQSTNKSPFEYFLPVWINEVHAAQCKSWREALKSSYMEIGSKAFQVNGEDESIIEVFPRLINQMIVEVMRPDAEKSAAIATFEAMCNFWRTLRWLVDTRPTLLARVVAMLSKFVSNETSRHKDTTPDLGVALVLFTVLQGHKDCPTRSDFINAYADENALRCVMWWQRSGTRPEPVPVFQATQVSREICMFQMMVVDLIIADVGTTLKEIEETNCKLPQRLDRLQAQWREQKSSIGSWSAYFRCIGASQPAFQSESAWIADCVSRAAAKGPKYGSGGDKGKGKGGSKGGKGKGRGKR